MLAVSDLTLAAGDITLVRGASFEVHGRETVGLVGESGSGKSMLALAMMGCLPRAVQVVRGEVVFDGEDLLRMDPRERARRHGKLAMIFQEPRAALNPVMRVDRQIARARRSQRRKAGDEVSIGELLEQVGIRDAARVARSYPHQLSGGMCQRVLIAMMLACRPEMLIADEPTTALDVTVQAQIFALLGDVQERSGLGMLLITHDLGVAAQTCDRIVVLYGGQVMELGAAATVLRSASHPYSRYLINSLEAHDPAMVVDSVDLTLNGCRFAHRCTEADRRCFESVPVAVTSPEGTTVYCHRREEGRDLAARDQVAS